MEKNLTEGSVFKNLIIFSIPFFISYLLQTLYGLFDLYFIGMFNDAAVITAVATGSQIMHLVTVVVVGFAMGITVLVGRCAGAGDRKEMARVVGNGIILFSILALALTACFILFRGRIIQIMSVPEESLASIENYLFVCFLGIPFIVGYNVISGIYRGIGDSKTPMYFVAFTCIVNIGLDYILVGPLALGALGAAIATVLAQAVCMLLALLFLIKRRPVGLKKEDLTLNRKKSLSTLSIGAPIAVQDLCIQISFLIITMIANQRGVEIAAAVGIVEKIIGILFLVPSTMLSAISAMAAQNLGANKPKRAKQTLWMGMAIAAGIGLALSILSQFTAGQAVGLFTTDSAVVVYGAQYLHSYAFDCFFAAFHFCFSGYFVASNHSNISFLHNILSIILVRVPGAYLASVWYPQTLFPMGIAAPAGSLLSTLICVLAFVIIERKTKEQ